MAEERADEVLGSGEVCLEDGELEVEGGVVIAVAVAVCGGVRV